MLSFDEKTMQALDQLKLMVDFIKNPGDFKNMVDEAKKTIEEHKKALADLLNGKEIKEYYDEAMNEIESWKKQHWDAVASHNSKVDAAHKQISDRISTLTDRENAV